jgi:hypothetical protein
MKSKSSNMYMFILLGIVILAVVIIGWFVYKHFSKSKSKQSYRAIPYRDPEDESKAKAQATVDVDASDTLHDVVATVHILSEHTETLKVFFSIVELSLGRGGHGGREVTTETQTVNVIAKQVKEMKVTFNGKLFKAEETGTFRIDVFINDSEFPKAVETFPVAPSQFFKMSVDAPGFMQDVVLSLNVKADDTQNALLTYTIVERVGTKDRKVTQAQKTLPLVKGVQFVDKIVLDKQLFRNQGNGDYGIEASVKFISETITDKESFDLSGTNFVHIKATPTGFLEDVLLDIDIINDQTLTAGVRIKVYELDSDEVRPARLAVTGYEDVPLIALQPFHRQIRLSKGFFINEFSGIYKVDVTVRFLANEDTTSKVTSFTVPGPGLVQFRGADVLEYDSRINKYIVSLTNRFPPGSDIAGPFNDVRLVLNFSNYGLVNPPERVVPLGNVLPGQTVSYEFEVDGEIARNAIAKSAVCVTARFDTSYGQFLGKKIIPMRYEPIPTNGTWATAELSYCGYPDDVFGKLIVYSPDKRTIPVRMVVAEVSGMDFGEDNFYATEIYESRLVRSQYLFLDAQPNKLKEFNFRLPYYFLFNQSSGLYRFQFTVMFAMDDIRRFSRTLLLPPVQNILEITGDETIKRVGKTVYTVTVRNPFITKLDKMDDKIERGLNMMGSELTVSVEGSPDSTTTFKDFPAYTTQTVQVEVDGSTLRPGETTISAHLFMDGVGIVLLDMTEEKTVKVV